MSILQDVQAQAPKGTKRWISRPLSHRYQWQSTCQMCRKVFSHRRCRPLPHLLSKGQALSHIPRFRFPASDADSLHTCYFVPSSGHSPSAFIPSTAPYGVTMAAFNPSSSPSPQSVYDTSTPTLHLQMPTLVDENPSIDSPMPCASPVLSIFPRRSILRAHLSDFDTCTVASSFNCEQVHELYFGETLWC